MSTEPLLGLLQFADGLFPAGGHAHSFGLEACVQDGRVRSRAELQAFVEALLEGSAGPCDAAAVAAASRSAARRDIASALDLDARLEAMKPAVELREASRQMGRQTLRAAVALLDEASLAGLWEAVEAGRTPGHHALVFGFVGQAVGSAPEAAAAAYLYSTAAMVVGAALRLLPLGQVEGQRTLWALRPLLARLAAEAAGKGADDLWSFTPGIEIAAMRHARLPARLFRS
ncbi:MAG TPA: urease accessory UreF family protein [Vicinamibacteria bacterium]|nr:urease accessory UreF family protein [Vicinamibacteria bacterium]